MIRWMLFSTLATGLFWGLYRLTLGRDRWFNLSRAYLIIMLAFGLAYPLVRLQAVPIVDLWGGELPEVEVVGTQRGASAIDGQALEHASWNFTAIVYCAGGAVTLMVLLVSFGRVYERLRRMPYERRGDVKLHFVDDDTEPFSFFSHIVVGTRGMGGEEMRLVLAHENEHVRQRHSWDVLIVRLMCCVAWFNPFVWLMLGELRAVHEYQADATVRGGESKDYLRLLYRQTIGLGYGHITNNFHSINLKKRITMMKRKKTRYGAWKVLAALPVAALLLMVGCKPASSENVDSEKQAVVEPQATVEPELFDPQTAPEGFIPPEYPDGEAALYKYIAQNIQYPEQAKTNGIEGKVYVRFIVMDNGNIVNVEVSRGIGGGCDEEAVRVIKGMPKWKPAMHEGKPVNVQYVIPINFKLQ